MPAIGGNPTHWVELLLASMIEVSRAQCLGGYVPASKGRGTLWDLGGNGFPVCSSPMTGGEESARYHIKTYGGEGQAIRACPRRHLSKREAGDMVGRVMSAARDSWEGKCV